MLLPELVAAGVIIMIMYGALFIVKYNRAPSEVLNSVKKIMNYVVLLMFVVILIRAVYVLTFSVVPNSDLDRTERKRGIENFEQRMQDDASKIKDTTVTK